MPENIHHQLRPFRFISDAAHYPVKQHIRKWFHHHTQPDIIINFNYYFYFLKNLFPDIPLCTIINDDFVAQAKPWMKKSIASQVQDTCRSSDAVLTVSYPLLEKLRSINRETHLFFPWAEKNYSPPRQNSKRNVVLYFGHINHRLDFKLMEAIASAGITLRLTGPVQYTVNKDALKKLLLHKNVSLLPPSPMNEVDFSDVSCSILPYDLNIKSVNACSVSNRSFNLLSYGIPLVASALPGGIELGPDVISYCDSAEQFISRIRYFQHNFMNVQPSISHSLKGHDADDRYRLLCEIFETISGRQISKEGSGAQIEQDKILSGSTY